MKSKSLPTVGGTLSDSSEQVIHLARSREDTMDPFFTIDKRTTRRTTRRWSDPVRDLTMPVHGTGSDRPELIQSIGSFPNLNPGDGKTPNPKTERSSCPRGYAPIAPSG